MKLAIVHAVPEWGGAERYTADLARGLAERGHDVHVIVAPESRLHHELASTAAILHPLDLGLVVGWHSAIGVLNHPLNWADLYANPFRSRLHARLDSIAADGPIDVLLAQQVKEKLWVTDYGVRTGVPVAWTVHAPLEPWMKESAPGSMHRRQLRRLTGLVAVNRATLDDYRAFGFEPAVSAVVYNGIDIGFYAQGARDATRRALGVADDEVAVLMPARPYAGKGVGTLIDALARREGSERLRVFVAGGSRHVESFRAQAEGRGLGKTLTFLGHRDDMPDLLAASDIVTLPSFYEGLPYVISEAMAATRPVIATRVGGIPEMIVEGETGLMIDAGDDAALAAAFDRLASDAAERRRMGEAGRVRAEELFALDRMLTESEDAFARVAAAGARR